MGFGQRRLPRGVAIDLALGIGVALARGVGVALRGAPGIACGGLRRGSAPQLGLGGFQRLPLVAGVVPGLLQLIFDIDQPGTLGEAPCRAGRRMGGGDKSIPAPDVAFQRHQPLPGLQLRHQFRAALFGDDADLGEAARQLRRRLDMECERFGRLRAMQGRLR